MERLFFTINELTARAAKEANSMSGYVAGSATSEYQNMVNRVYDTVEKIKEKKPNLAEKAQHMAERYSRKLAEYFNAYYRNEASCPSILISGAGNFPVRKKEKQNSRRETLMNDWKYLENYATKIEHLLTMEQPILSGDAQAIELLEEKLESLIAEFRLQKVRKNKGNQLSGGERRRTEIARCLAIDPKFIMLDEPFAGVDPIAVEDIQQIVWKLKDKNIGILITDHNVQETLSITDRAYLLFEGKILFQGTPEELAANKIVREKYLSNSFVLRRKDFQLEKD